MNPIIRFVKAHGRMITLKVIIATALVVNHFWPDHLGSTLINLIWLLAF